MNGLTRASMKTTDAIKTVDYIMVMVNTHYTVDIYSVTGKYLQHRAAVYSTQYRDAREPWLDWKHSAVAEESADREPVKNHRRMN